MIGNKVDDLEVLRKSREVLAQTYVKWITKDGKGGHCAYGAVEAVVGSVHREYPLRCYLNPAAKALHPELKGCTGKREVHNTDQRDIFDLHPLIYVNNHTDKETTLAVFDAAILNLEMEIAKETPVRVRDLVAV